MDLLGLYAGTGICVIVGIGIAGVGVVIEVVGVWVRVEYLKL